jgi:CRP/FNR family transcriptional activator FtrB
MISREIGANQVRSVRLFRDLSDRHFRTLMKSASLRVVAPRTLLCREGDRPTVLYTLIEGWVELFAEHHDRRCTIAVNRPIKPCTIASILEDRNVASVRTLERSRFLLVPTEVIHELIETDLDFACAVAHELADDCHAIIGDFKDHRLRTTVERLAQWMLRFDTNAGGSGHFAIPYDKHTLASYLGMAPEYLSRNLVALASAGVVVHGRRVTLNDRSALAARAGLSLQQMTRDERAGRKP